MKNSTQGQIQTEQQKFHDHLKRAKLRLTSGRHMVFQEVMKAHGHFAAEELVKQCQKHGRKVSRATIYRSLRELRAAGIIRETAFGEKHQHYEHVYDEKLHHHARCIQCYRVIEFPCMEQDQRYVQILQKEKFQILGHELHFYGLCGKCVNEK